MRAAPGGTGGAYGACRLWDSVAKHNAVVWGRARAAVDAAASPPPRGGPGFGKMTGGGSAHGGDKQRGDSVDDVDDVDGKHRGGRGGVGGRGVFTFDEYYRAAMVDAYGDDLDALRLGKYSYTRGGAAAADRTNVGIIMRAIQAGVDVVPALQKELVMQFASLEELRELQSGGGGGDSDEQEEEDDDDDDDAVAKDASQGGSDFDSGNSSEDDDNDDDEEDSEQDDEVDYENTEYEHSSGSD